MPRELLVVHSDSVSVELLQRNQVACSEASARARASKAGPMGVTEALVTATAIATMAKKP